MIAALARLVLAVLVERLAGPAQIPGSIPYRKWRRRIHRMPSGERVYFEPGTPNSLQVVGPVFFWAPLGTPLPLSDLILGVEPGTGWQKVERDIGKGYRMGAYVRIEDKYNASYQEPYIRDVRPWRRLRRRIRGTLVRWLGRH